MGSENTTGNGFFRGLVRLRRITDHSEAIHVWERRALQKPTMTDPPIEAASGAAAG